MFISYPIIEAQVISETPFSSVYLFMVCIPGVLVGITTTKQTPYLKSSISIQASPNIQPCINGN